MSSMMSLQQAHQWIPQSMLVGAGGAEITRVHTDSRSILPGDVFVALAGENFDGNQFLGQARDKGAVAAICSSETLLRAVGLPGLVIDDTKKALGQLAQAWRKQFKLPLIAVTGSNGKTTVTQMIASVLRAYQPESMLATQGNFNNDIGVPLTLLRLRAEHRIAVLELGMNHPGEIALLAGMAQPTVALVNNAQREHLEFMDSVEAVAWENGAVFAALDISGVCIYRQDDAFSDVWRSLAGLRSKLTFSDQKSLAYTLDKVSAEGQADVFCRRCEWSGRNWQVVAVTPSGTLEFTLSIAGRHNISNAMAAIACTLAAGVPLHDIAAGLEAFEAVKGRSRAMIRILGSREFTLIDDTYNANPDSVRAAIEVLAQLPGPRLLVLGDMGEVGSQGPAFHAEVGAHAHRHGIDQLLTLGTLCEHATAAFGSGQHFDNMEALQTSVLELLQSARSVLVKGSRFMKMERVVDAILLNSEAWISSPSIQATQEKKEASCS